MNILGQDLLWRSRDKAQFEDRHFRLIKEAGFSNVRINLHPWRDGKIDTHHRLASDWLETLDWAIHQALANRLMAILDLHESHTMGLDPQGNRERSLATWRQLAERYRNLPPEVLFEILNEPNNKLTAELWNECLCEALKALRAANPTRMVVVGPTFWNDIDYLEKLELPVADRNLIVTVHYYRPMAFTHQGAPWTAQKNKRGILWNGTQQDRETVQHDFDKAQAWSEKSDRPIYLGEFGAYDKADMASRLRYVGFVARQAEKRGWSWSYWPFDADVIVVNGKPQRWAEPILQTLIPAKQ